MAADREGFLQGWRDKIIRKTAPGTCLHPARLGGDWGFLPSWSHHVTGRRGSRSGIGRALGRAARTRIGYRSAAAAAGLHGGDARLQLTCAHPEGEQQREEKQSETTHKASISDKVSPTRRKFLSRGNESLKRLGLTRADQLLGGHGLAFAFHKGQQRFQSGVRIPLGEQRDGSPNLGRHRACEF